MKATTQKPQQLALPFPNNGSRTQQLYEAFQIDDALPKMVADRLDLSPEDVLVRDNQRDEELSKAEYHRLGLEALRVTQVTAAGAAGVIGSVSLGSLGFATAALSLGLLSGLAFLPVGLWASIWCPSAIGGRIPVRNDKTIEDLSFRKGDTWTSPERRNRRRRAVADEIVRNSALVKKLKSSSDWRPSDTDASKERMQSQWPVLRKIGRTIDGVFNVARQLPKIATLPLIDKVLPPTSIAQEARNERLSTWALFGLGMGTLVATAGTVFPGALLAISGAAATGGLLGDGILPRESDTDSPEGVIAETLSDYKSLLSTAYNQVDELRAGRKNGRPVV